MKLSQIDRNWCEAVRHELNIRGWGEKTKLANALGIKTQTLSGWLNGQRRATEEERRRICDELGMDYSNVINGRQIATAKHSSVVAQVAGHGNTISVMQKSDLTTREQELIAALREWGNEKMIDSMLAKIDEIKKMSAF